MSFYKINITPAPALRLTPKTLNPHNSGLEVDIDFTTTAFFIVRWLLKCDVVKVIQVAPPHAAALPHKRKTLISWFPIDNFLWKFTNRQYHRVLPICMLTRYSVHKKRDGSIESLQGLPPKLKIWGPHGGHFVESFETCTVVKVNLQYSQPFARNLWKVLNFWAP